MSDVEINLDAVTSLGASSSEATSHLVAQDNFEIEDYVAWAIGK